MSSLSSSILRRYCLSRNFFRQQLRLYTSTTIIDHDLDHQRQIPKTFNEYEKLKQQQFEQPENAKLLRVAIVGCPNAGKSTLLNRLVSWKVSAVSTKVHTTRCNVVAIFLHGDTQIEFVDTPGLVNQRHIVRHNLESTFRNDVQQSLISADIVAIIADVSNMRERQKLNRGLLELLRKNRDKESLLVLNKVDKLRHKRELLDITATLTSGIVNGVPIRQYESEKTNLRQMIKRGQFKELFEKTEKYFSYKDQEMEDSQEDGIGWPNFSRVFMISALHNDGIDDLRSYFVGQAKHRPWLYNHQTVTLQNPKDLIYNGLREVCLDLLHQEIPYQLQFRVVMWETDDIGNLYIAVDLMCPAKFQSLVIGPKGNTISTIVRKSREVLCDIFRCDVSLKIAVKSFTNKK